MAMLSQLPKLRMPGTDLGDMQSVTPQQQTRQQLLQQGPAPAAPPRVPQMPQPGLAPQQVQPPAPRESMFADDQAQLGQSMAATAGMAQQERVPIKFLVGTAVANRVAQKRDPGSLTGGPGSYGGPGLQGSSNRLLRLAGTQVGVPYVFGDLDPKGGGSAAFDCSGLTKWAFGRLGVELPHSAAAQSQMFPKVGRDQLRPGDLVFYDYGRLGGASDHVAIYVGNGRQIAASSSADQVTVQPVDWGNFIWGGRTPFAGGAPGGGGGQGGRSGTGRRGRRTTGRRTAANTERQRM